MADRKFTITKGGELTPSRNRAELDRDADKAKQRLDEAVAKGNITAKQREELWNRIASAARRATDEEVKGTEAANRATGERVRLREEEARRAKEAGDRVTELQNEIERIDRELATTLNTASKERGEALRRQREALHELVKIQRDYNVDTSIEQAALKETQRLLNNNNAALRRRAQATGEVTTAVTQATQATVRDTQATAEATKASTEHTVAKNAEAEAVRDVGRAHEETARRIRNSGGGGGGGNNPPPPGGGGGGDDPWDEYFRKQLEKKLAELTNPIAAEVRARSSEVSDLNRRESFQRGADRLYGLRAEAQELFDRFNAAAKQVIDTNLLKDAEGALRRLERQITQTTRALDEGRGDADGLARSLRGLIDDTEKLSDATEKQTQNDVQSYNIARQRLELARNLAAAELQGNTGDQRTVASLERVLQRAENALTDAKDRFGRGDTIDLGKTILQFNTIAKLTREETEAAREGAQIDAERRTSLQAEARDMRDRLNRDLERLEVARKTAATLRDQRLIDDQILATRSRLSALERATDLGGIFREPTMQGLRFDTARSWRDTNDAIRATRRSSAEYTEQVDRTSSAIKNLIGQLDGQRMSFYKAGWTDNQIDLIRGRLEKYQMELRKAARAGRDISGLRSEVFELGHAMRRSRADLNAFDAAIDRLTTRFGFLRRAFATTEASTRRFSLFTTVATVALAPLLSLVLGVGSGLLSLAASAVGAGSALGGALVAGIAQALPVLGLFAFAFKGLSDVLQISNLQQQNQIANIGRAARGVGDSAGGVDKLADSNDNLTESQKRLSEARQQAIRDLEDLADKEKQAELAARDSTLSVIEAEVALREAQDSGSVLDVERAQLGLEEARLRQNQAFRDRNRTRADAAVTRSRGVEGNEQVVAARQQLAQAERSLASARNAGAGAAGGLSQATAVLDEKMRRLSPVQKELLRSINDLRESFSKGPFQGIRDIILKPFVGAIDNITALSKDNEVVKSFSGLATSISGVLDTVFQGLTGPRGKSLLVFLNGEASKNVKVIGDGLSSLGGIFEKIIRAASPLLNYVLKGIAGTLDEIDNKLTTAGLTKFFEDQKPAIDGFGKIFRETFILLKNLFTVSSPAGNSLLGQFGKFLEGINKQFADPARRRELQNFFKEAGEGFAALAGALKDLGIALFRNLDMGTLKTFATVISEVIAPAIARLVAVSTKVSQALGFLLDLPLVPWALGWIATIVIFGKTWNTIAGIMGTVRIATIGLISKLFDLAAASKLASGLGGSGGMIGFGAALDKEGGRLGNVGKRLTGLRGAMQGIGRTAANFGPWGLLIATGLLAFSGPLLDLADHFGLLKNKTDEAKEALKQYADATKDVAEKQKNEGLAELDRNDARRARNDRQKELNVELGKEKKLLEAFQAAPAGSAEKKRLGALLETQRVEVAQAEDDLKRAQIAYDDARKRFREAKAETTAAQGTAVRSSDQFNESIADRASKGAFDALRKQRGKSQKDYELVGQEAAEWVVKGLEDSDEWNKLPGSFRQKFQAAIAAFVEATGGKAPTKDQVKIIYSLVRKGEGPEEIARAIRTANPTLTYTVNVDKASVAQSVRETDKVTDSLNRALGPAVALGLNLRKGVFSQLLDSKKPKAEGAELFQPKAEGGLIRAKRGGQRILAAEKGYDEFIISTDPSKRSRSLDLITQATRRLALPGGGSSSKIPGSDDPEWGKGYGDPPSLRRKARGGSASASGGPLQTFYRMFRRAQMLDGMDIPYSWGGGHGSSPVVPSTGIASDGNDGTNITGLDCSSSVSAVMQAGYSGFPTITSGMFPSQSVMKPGPGLVTVWSNDGHVFMSFGSQDWGTGGGNPAGGPGFNSHSKGGFTATHPYNLGPEANTPSVAFNQIYGRLVGAGIEEITKTGSSLRQLGSLAVQFGDNFVDKLKPKSKIVRGIADKVSGLVSDFLGPFKGFRTGGYTPAGSDSQPYLGVLHGGEGVIDAQSMRAVRSGKTGKDVLDDIVTAILKAIKSGLGTIKDPIERAAAGAGLNRESVGKVQETFPSYLRQILDVTAIGGKGGMRFDLPKVGKTKGFAGDIMALFEGAASALKKGTPVKDIEGAVGRFIRLSGNRFKDLLQNLSDRMVKVLTALDTELESIKNTTQKKNETVRKKLTERIEGKYNESTGVFEAGEDSSAATGGDSEAQGATEEAAKEQRDNLVARKSAIRVALLSAAGTKRGLLKKKRRLEEIFVALGKDLKKAPKGRKAAIQKQMNRLKAQIKNIDKQVSQISQFEKQKGEELGEVSGEIQDKEAEIGAAQGARIDALVSEATSGDLNIGNGGARLDQAAALASQMGDRTRLRAIARARAQMLTANADADINVAQANARLSILKQGSTASNRGAVEGFFKSITASLGSKKTALESERSELIAAGVDENSEAVKNLTAQIIDLETAVEESTKAYYATRNENIDARIGLLNSKLRAAELAGDVEGAAAIRKQINDALQERINLANEQIQDYLDKGYSENSTEIINLRTSIQENTNAITENTNAITGTTQQNFSSTAWQLFREAIFNGNGGMASVLNGIALSPASVVPQMAVGGSILSDGLIYAHRGEQIVPASVSRSYGGGTTNIEVNVNEAEQTADPLYIAKRLAFELAGR